MPMLHKIFTSFLYIHRQHDITILRFGNYVIFYNRNIVKTSFLIEDKTFSFEVTQFQYLFIFIGGAIGALFRYLISFLNVSGSFPVGTFVANLIGAFVMGILTTLSISFFKNRPTLKKAITTGFLGALTTFSTFQIELVHMFNHQQFIILLLYAVTSYVLGIFLCHFGMTIGGALS